MASASIVSSWENPVAVVRLGSALARIGSALDRALEGIVALASVLVLPVSLLLFLQWPLRDVLQLYSREANDLAQLLFAFYVGVAITAATRRRSHLAFAGSAALEPKHWRATLARVASLVILLPWSAFVLYAAWPAIVQSVRQLESFPETFNPGYFLLRVALGALLVLVLLQALLDALLPNRRIER